MKIPEKSVLPEVPLQFISDQTIRIKYFKEGVDVDNQSIHARNAKALANLEENAQEWEPQFLDVLESEEFLLAGRIKANAGAGIDYTSTINCTVSGKIEDSMRGIFERVGEAALTLKAGCGIGYSFDSLRPKGALVKGVGAPSSGPIPFMRVFDATCNTIMSGGDRRGAQMGTFSIEHPDIEDFITVKNKAGELESLNLSVKLTNRFFEAVEKNEDLPLRFEGETYKTVSAKYLFDLIMDRTYKYSDPGFLMIDRINEMNNNWFCEDIQATNPCGEQPLPPFGACLLSSVNLVRFIDDPFTPQASFNWERFEYVVRVATRMMDNVVGIANLPLKQQMLEIQRKRRHGLGFTGLGDACIMLGIKYGSEAAQDFAENVSFYLSLHSLDEGANLAVEKGVAPIFNELWVVDGEGFYRNDAAPAWDKKLSVDEVRSRGITAPVVNGLELWLGSKFLKQFELYEHGRAVLEKLRCYGCRFTHFTSIAPTGTISLAANNITNGIEPAFSWEYLRNVILAGKKTKVQVRVYDFAYLLYFKIKGIDVSKVMRQTTDKFDTAIELPDYFVTTDDVSAKDHIMMQARAQKWIDSSISKTINVPTSTTFEEFKELYFIMYREGLKGGTTYRFNPEKTSGVLVKDEDLTNTFYTFTLSDGTELTVRADETVEYEGEEHKASNLHDAIVSGKYGWY